MEWVKKKDVYMTLERVSLILRNMNIGTCHKRVQETQQEPHLELMEILFCHKQVTVRERLDKWGEGGLDNRWGVSAQCTSYAWESIPLHT